MEETLFKIEYDPDISRAWIIWRYHPAANAWVCQDMRRFRKSAVRYARKRAGNAVLVLTKTDAEGTMELTYRRSV